MKIPKQQIIGKRIRASREEAGLSQHQLGEKVGYSAMGISHLENGDRKLKIEDLQRIASSLNVDINYLLEPVTNRVYPTVFNRRGSDDTTEEQKKAEIDALKKLDEAIKNIE